MILYNKNLRNFCFFSERGLTQLYPQRYNVTAIMNFEKISFLWENVSGQRYISYKPEKEVF